MTLQEFFQSRRFKWLLITIGALIILLLVFQLGVFVGFHEANYSYKWGDNYSRMFGGPSGGMIHDFEGRDFTSGHGTAGTIAKIDGSNIIIKSQDGKEKVATINDRTVFKKGNMDIKASDLKVDDRVVVIGSPNDDGAINAEIIRIFDLAPPTPLNPGPLPNR